MPSSGWHTLTHLPSLINPELTKTNIYSKFFPLCCLQSFIQRVFLALGLIRVQAYTEKKVRNNTYVLSSLFYAHFSLPTSVFFRKYHLELSLYEVIPINVVHAAEFVSDLSQCT